MIGQTLGHYRIDAKLGEGGMGVVYRAFDTHLDRAVAIKVLRPDATASPDRKRRFVQEAKSASALNHPGIVHIYDIDSANLPDGPIDFIAMEFVPGKTLDQYIGKGGLSLNDALKYGIQIADALARAHAAGIVHRDLKPANIIVADDGRVKLLDFGLAKLTEVIDGDPEGATATMAAQATPQTEEGSILGTVAYMSPEQAEGRKVDGRSDIFSFGSVLYEMVTGRRAFEGTNKISTLGAILHTEPKAASEISAGVPTELDKIIARCLRKDPERRAQGIADIKLALEELKQESESGRLSGTSGQRRPFVRPRGRLDALSRSQRELWRWSLPQPPGLVAAEAAGFRSGALRMGANHEPARLGRPAGALAGRPHAHLHPRPFELHDDGAGLREDAAQRRAGAAHPR
jgi:serine/threonine protein kinase